MYDVTSYVSQHPGGDAILNTVGRDSSVGFHGEQHGEATFAFVEEYRIGQVVG